MRSRCLGSVFTIVLLLGLSFLFNVEKAEAQAREIEGCKGKYILKAQPWVLDTYYQVPHRVLIDLRNIRLSATTAYYYCPNGVRASKIKPLWVALCYSHLERAHWMFDGVKFEGRWADYDSTINLPVVKVEDDGTEQNCTTYNIPSDSERWLEPLKSAGWLIRAEIVRHARPDEVRWFRDDDASKFRIFTPETDASLSDWYK